MGKLAMLCCAQNFFLFPKAFRHVSFPFYVSSPLLLLLLLTLLLQRELWVSAGSCLTDISCIKYVFACWISALYITQLDVVWTTAWTFHYREIFLQISSFFLICSYVNWQQCIRQGLKDGCVICVVWISSQHCCQVYWIFCLNYVNGLS